jgi:hypothetical protein
MQQCTLASSINSFHYGFVAVGLVFSLLESIILNVFATRCICGFSASGAICKSSDSCADYFDYNLAAI